MAGNMTNTVYETDAGNRFPIRLGQTTTEIPTNDPPGGAVTEYRHAIMVSTPARSFGLRPRKLHLKRSLGIVGAGDAARDVYVSAYPVILTKTAFDVLLATGGEIDYANEIWVIAGGLSES
jgi:hypothetical protein